ncbi:MAG: NAD-dependent deacylase [Chloroflexi bacterium]|nr:NAD-dependent deacylase [Chloroflexota bacterium]
MKAEPKYIPQSILSHIDKDTRITALTGAGISAESGIPTFRGKDGLWKKFRAEELATPEAFRKDHRTVWEWYRFRQDIIGKASPNPAHHALAEMEKLFCNFHIITQNVDGLHRRAGSSRLCCLHGDIWEARCIREGTVTACLPGKDGDPVPLCPSCGALMRPNIVWFGEALPADELEKSYRLARGSDIFLVIGTSSLVYPAAALPMIAYQAGAALIEVNPDESPLSEIAVHIKEKAGTAVPGILEEFRSALG